MPPAVNRTMTPLEWVLLITLSLLWGSSFLSVAVAVTALTPTTIVAFRVAIAAILLLAIVTARGIRLPIDARSWRDFFTIGLINNVIPFTLIAWGQTYVAGGLASILNATTPFFTIVLAHFLTADDRMTPARLAGVLTGFAGVVIMIGPSALGAISDDLLPQLAILAAAAAYGLSPIFGLRFSRRGIPPLATATGQMIAASAVMVPVMLVADQPWTLAMPPIEVVAAVVALGVLSTVLAYVIYYRILATAGSVNISLVTFLIPVSAIAMGALVLGERLAPRHFLGMAAIGLGLALIDGRLLRFLVRVPSAGESR